MFAQIDPLYLRMRPRKAFVRVLSHLLFQGRFLTTDYRWLNYFILTGLSLLKHVPQMKSAESPIFVVGAGRSGSTIMGKVLSMHQAIGFLNEPKALWYTVCPQEDVNGHFGNGPARYRLTSQDVTPQGCEAARRLLGAYLMITGADRVLDKNPEMVFRVPFVKSIFPDAKFVFLVRNGWDTISSIVKWSQQHARSANGDVEDWWGVNQRKWHFMLEQLVTTEPLLSDVYQDVRAFTRHADMAAVEWIVTMQEGKRLMRSRPDCTHLVHYEDLTSQPQTTLQSLLGFCELDEDRVFMSYAQQVLKSVPHKKRLELSPAIRSPFLETMRALGYNADTQP
jgi:hypothetical protein